VHHQLNNGAAINQGDAKGITPLHRAAAMAHIDGYLEIYELLLVGVLWATSAAACAASIAVHPACLQVCSRRAFVQSGTRGRHRFHHLQCHELKSEGVHPNPDVVPCSAH
jgi:ankyrin repeat protein